MTGTLYLVATPIGNLRDVTLRALDVLREVSIVACEDTRLTARLLARHGIATKTVSCHAHNESRRASELGALLLEGRDVALVSDAGTPCVSDPGARLLAWAQAHDVPIRAIPGPSAVTAAVSLSGFGGAGFCFSGFLPLKPKARRDAIAELAQERRAVVLFETARRTPRLLADLASTLGARRALVARELTKLHEEHRRGSLEELAAWAARTSLKGELTFVVEGRTGPGHAEASFEGGPSARAGMTPTPHDRFRELLSSGLPRRDAVKALARELGIPRREAYRLSFDTPDSEDRAG